MNDEHDIAKIFHLNDFLLVFTGKNITTKKNEKSQIYIINNLTKYINKMSFSIKAWFMVCYLISTSSVSGQIQRGEFFGDDNIPTNAKLAFPQASPDATSTFRPSVQKRVRDVYFFGTKYNDIQVIIEFILI